MNAETHQLEFIRDGAHVDVVPDEHWGWVFTEGPMWRRVLATVLAVIGGFALSWWLMARSGDLPAPGIAAVGAIAFALPALGLVDSLTKLLPNAFMYPAYALAAVTAGAAGFADGGLDSLLPAVGTAAAAWVTYFVIWFAAPAGGFGFGDVRLAGLLGFALGFHSVVVAFVGILVLPLLLAIPVGAVTAWWARSGERSSSIPFGPMMIVGAVVCLAYPGAVSAAALSILG